MRALPNSCGEPTFLRVYTQATTFAFGSNKLLEVTGRERLICFGKVVIR
jgi:hypothetical protein